MCKTCCKECHGWCRAFTATEMLLSLLEAALLIVFIVFLIFLILHFIVCPDNEKDISQIYVETEKNTSLSEPTHSTQSSEDIQRQTTLSPNIQCTWTPSQKTKASTQYFEYNVKILRVTSASTKLDIPKTLLPSSSYDDELNPDQTDGETTDDKKAFVLSLVKVTTQNEIVYGCILTIISEFWTVTAASCTESIEDENSLDSYVMVDNFEDIKHARIHTVVDAVKHPQYNSMNKSYDIIALKSADKIATSRKILKLPTLIDYYLITIGERLLILGFGSFRSSTNTGSYLYNLYEAAVHVLPASLCHLLHRMDGDKSVCAGALYARGGACNYCAGTPLLHESILLGIMSENKFCRVLCEPALYVNLAVVSDWLRSIIDDE